MNWLCSAVLEEDELKQYFQEDLGLNLCPLSQGTLEQCAGEAWGKVRPEDREVPPSAWGTPFGTITCSTIIRF